MKLKTFYENFELMAEAPNGIQKLRDIILQLAVQGKLVPQDANDESASELLEKIAVAKKRLVNEGKIRIVKPLPKISDEEIPYELPIGWQWERLGNLQRFVNGFAFKSRDYLDAGIGIVRIGDIVNGEISTSTMKHISPEVAESLDDSLYVVKGDLLIAMSGATTGKLGFNLNDHKYLLNQRVGKLGLIEVEKRYAYYYLTTKIKEHLKISAGSAIPNLSTQQINNILFPLPPSNEQKRIVAKVDELMIICDDLESRKQKTHHTCIKLNDASIDKLLTAPTPNKFNKHWHRIQNNFDLLYSKPENVTKLRQAILQMAVQGKLAPQDPKDETSSVLLEKIQTERERLVKEGKIKKAQPLPPIESSDLPLFIPDGWAYERFGNISIISGGVTKGRKLVGRKTDLYPYLRVANVQRWYLDMSEVKEIEIPIDELEKYSLVYGDILITEGGDWDKVGRAAIWKNQLKICLHQNHIFRSRLYNDEVERKWILIYLNSPIGRKYFAGSSKQTTNLASINMTQLKNYVVQLPPTNEQKRIVTKVDELMVLCDDLENKLSQGQSSSSRLVEAVVADLLVA